MAERSILEFIKQKKTATLDEIIEQGFEPNSAMGALYELQKQGAIELKEWVEHSYELTEEAERYLKEGFPEETVLKKSSIAQLTEQEKKIGLFWARKNGWLKVEGTSLKVLNKPELSEHRRICERIKASKGVSEEEVKDLIRRGLVKRKGIRKVVATIKEEAYSGLQLSRAPLIKAITSEVIKSKEWKKGVEPYRMVKSGCSEIGKRHPLDIIIAKIKSIFVRMGFTEMEDGPYIEDAFWNFDALLQPQDHPSRDLADTFYLSGQAEPKGKVFTERTKEVHERFWQEEWKPEIALQKVLRTHTTAVSARTLFQKKGPLRMFNISRVFRNEATDQKHLTEFHHVEGIASWEGASFRDLLSIIKGFYSMLGLQRVRFIPSYYPYTEPSVQVEFFYEKKKSWIEIGGAGVFRPEVSEILEAPYPVLAFGQSLERPLMVLLEMDDIRNFYISDLDWLREGRWQRIRF
ncbi:MAG: phenylalanine--tRNA ligase subunit alpha [Candidatus Anstonellales archaeon]